MNPVKTLLVLALLGATTARAQENYFGESENSGHTLIGILYDLKQDQKRQPTGVQATQYPGIIREFLGKNWDESVLNRYFRSARPLYTSQIYIPVMGAGAAPKAFEVEDVMKASCWVIHYKGQVSPPADGTYRFICYADDLMVLAVNGQVLCDGSRDDTPLNLGHRNQQGPKGRLRAGNGDFSFGDWIELKKDEPVDLDILIGERPGGQFAAFVLYEKQGDTYPETPEGLPRFPLFQLAPHDTPGYPEDRAPPFSLSPGPAWKACQ